MSIKVVGVSERKGNYQGVDYHNVYLHTTREADNGGIGLIAEQMKIKFANVQNVFGKPMSVADWQNLLGHEVSCAYNRFGNIESVRVIK